MGTQQPVPSVVAAAGVAIFRPTGELLLGRHTHDGCWATFGGAVESGEDARAAAVREVLEEAGITLEDVALIGTFGSSPTYTVDYPDGSSQAYDVTMFGCVVDHGCAVAPDGAEILQTRWFAPAEMQDVRLAADMAEIVPAAIAWFRSRSAH